MGAIGCEIKFRFQLKEKETGDAFFQPIALFDEGSGLMQHPVDLSRFEILAIDRFSGKTTDDKKFPKNVFENDVIRYKVNSGMPGAREYQDFVGLVVWDKTMFAFACKVRENYTHNMLCHAEKIEIIGNLRENPELIHEIGEIQPPKPRTRKKLELNGG